VILLCRECQRELAVDAGRKRVLLALCEMCRLRLSLETGADRSAALIEARVGEAFAEIERAAEAPRVYTLIDVRQNSFGGLTAADWERTK